MNILLDTCTFLWIIQADKKLSKKAIDAFENKNNTIYLSVISLWEMIIKYKLGRLPFPNAPEMYVPEQCKIHDIEILELSLNAVTQLTTLPDVHNDPFDRMLICQAKAHQYEILTPDKHIKKYPVHTLWK